MSWRILAYPSVVLEGGGLLKTAAIVLIVGILRASMAILQQLATVEETVLLELNEAAEFPGTAADEPLSNNRF